MDILMSGSTGFLGEILKTKLCQMNNNVIELKDVISENSTDIRESFSIKSPISPEIVMHVAGKAHFIPRTISDVQQFFDINVKGTENLANSLRELPQMPKSFIFISTVSVYGREEGRFIDESHPLLGDSPYARSKILAEEFLQKWAKEHGVILGILRLPLIAGPTPPGNLGMMIEGIRTGKYLSIGKADARKSIVWAEDIAMIIPKLAELGGVYNLTDGYNPTFGELEDALSKVLGKSKPRKVPTWIAKTLGKAGDIIGARAPINSDKVNKIISSLTFNDAKAKVSLGWNPSIVLNKVSEIIK